MQVASSVERHPSPGEDVSLHYSSGAHNCLTNWAFSRGFVKGWGQAGRSVRGRSDMASIGGSSSWDGRQREKNEQSSANGSEGYITGCWS